jgi:predicted phosphoribosyltransferase
MEPDFRFRDRTEAGQQLALQLKSYADMADGIVLALPRGGVPVGAEVAAALHLPFDVYLVRKLGMPGHEELAIGAIAQDQSCVFNNDIVAAGGIDREQINQIVARELEELERRDRLYRNGLSKLYLKGQTVIVVDDGLATGATMKAAIGAIRLLQPRTIVVAVPVGAQEACNEIAPLVDHLVCLYRPVPFLGIGRWYEDFCQTADDEVLALLQRGRFQRS